jgi:hypothetical protein
MAAFSERNRAMSAIEFPSSFVAARPAGALVSKVDPIAHTDQFLHLTDAGGFEWVMDPDQATPFASMREATRMAIRLPAGQRAFGVPAQHH